MNLTDILHAVDVHAEGELTRVVVGGLPPSRSGANMAEQRLALMEDDGLRRYLLGEPRGHLCLHAVCVYPPADPDAAAAIVIMESTDYPAMSGSNLICAATVLLETGMVPMREPVTEFAIETPAGLVRVEARCAGGSCESVRFENVPAYVVGLDLPIELPGWGGITVDVAWGGAFFAFVDAAAFGLEIAAEQADKLAELGSRITASAAEQIPVEHPLRPDLHTITFTTFVGPPRAGGDGRNATVVSPGRLDRSACGTATSARLAVLHARNQIGVGVDFVHESVISSTFVGRIEGLTQVGDLPAVRPSISGRAWITGIHQLGRDRRDPLGAGFAVADTWRGANPEWTIDMGTDPNALALHPGAEDHLVRPRQ
jgi:proline racemase